ncbi:Hypothetical predicted protein [Octopus vulgaris]|uniref:Uncharacterized protein n=1 Tax=Octopus vulgaris TaxID=6645 RepID=A0AA36AJ48_OCTVU|nr:Hypothetical predicted protein [Octopus vulgaris]
MKYDIPKGEARIFKRSILNSTNVTNSPAIERVSPNDSTMSDPTNFTSQIGTTTTAADYPTTTNNPHTKANHSYIVVCKMKSKSGSLFRIASTHGVRFRLCGSLTGVLIKCHAPLKPRRMIEQDYQLRFMG